MNIETIQQLRQLPVEGVAERLGLRVTRHKSLCPFHDDHHASLTFNVRRNTYRCFACDAHGGTIDLVMRHLHKDFPDACRWLADATNIIVEEYRPQTPSAVTPLKPFDALRYAGFFERPWLSDEAQRFLFEERGIDRRVVRWCRLTSWTDRHGTHWLQTPYYDTEWRLTGMQSRNLDYGKAGSAADVPRFRFPYGSRCSVYNLPVTALLREGEPLYITEGCSDCWAMLSAGHKAVAIPSATLLSESDKRLLRGLAERLGTTFHMFPDRDAPGERLFMQLGRCCPDSAIISWLRERRTSAKCLLRGGLRNYSPTDIADLHGCRVRNYSPTDVTDLHGCGCIIILPRMSKIYTDIGCVIILPRMSQIYTDVDAEDLD